MFRRSWCVTAAVGLLFLGGCRPGGGTVSPTADPLQTYGNAYRSVMMEYRTKVGALTSRPLPRRSPGMSAKEFRAQVAVQVEDMANAVTATGAQMETLHPPPSLQEFHDSGRDFFRVFADGYRQWAAAIRTGTRREASRASEAATESEIAALQKILTTGEKAGMDLTEVKRTLAELQAEAAAK